MAEKTSTPGRRFIKLAGMTASIAGKAVSNSIKSFNANDEENDSENDRDRRHRHNEAAAVPHVTEASGE